MTDCCIIGGGIIGLSIARELAGRGLSVRVLSRDARRDTASWAAAGIFPPAPLHAGCPPGEALTAWSDRLHREWSGELLAETGIDNELRACGGLHVATNAAALDRLRNEADAWRTKGARAELLDAAGVAACEPAVAAACGRGLVVGGMLLPEERRIRPPRHLEALERSCAGRGVAITPAATAEELIRGGRRIEGVVATVAGRSETVRAGSYVLAAGAWSGAVAETLGLRIDTRPIRGQIALVQLPRQVLRHVVNRGLDYLVPREDGRLLVGSTIEDVGFDRATTEEAIARLLGVAADLLGDLSDARLEQAWAGLRPGSADGLPAIGRVPSCDNAFIAAGHFRAGLHQSTGTAVMLADLIEGRQPALDPAAYAPDRPPAPPGRDSVEAYRVRAAAESA
jgi:glycine oxidase